MPEIDTCPGESRSPPTDSEGSSANRSRKQMYSTIMVQVIMEPLFYFNKGVKDVLGPAGMTALPFAKAIGLFGLTATLNTQV